MEVRQERCEDQEGPTPLQLALEMQVGPPAKPHLPAACRYWELVPGDSQRTQDPPILQQSPLTCRETDPHPGGQAHDPQLFVTMNLPCLNLL
jgi:hypothetical protein